MAFIKKGLHVLGLKVVATGEEVSCPLWRSGVFCAETSGIVAHVCETNPSMISCILPGNDNIIMITSCPSGEMNNPEKWEHHFSVLTLNTKGVKLFLRTS